METLSGIYATGLVTLTDNMNKIGIDWKLLVQEPSELRVFFISVSNFTVFQPRIEIDSSSFLIRSSQVVLEIN